MRETAVVHSARRGGVVDMGKVGGPLLSVRVSPDMLKRADRLIPKVGRNREVATMSGRVTRSTVVKLALLRGLAALEAEYS